MSSTRDRLIGSTQELLAERGYSATSPRAVLDRSGAGQGSLYHHFVDKSDLGRVALERTADEFRAEWKQLLSSPGTARERIVACFGHGDEDVEFGCSIGRMSQDEGVMTDAALSTPVAASLSWLTDRIHDVILEGVQNGELSAGLPDKELATSITALIQGCYVVCRATRDAQPFRDTAVAVDALLRLHSRES